MNRSLNHSLVLLTAALMLVPAGCGSRRKKSTSSPAPVGTTIRDYIDTRAVTAFAPGASIDNNANIVCNTSSGVFKISSALDRSSVVGGSQFRQISKLGAVLLIDNGTLNRVAVANGPSLTTVADKTSLPTVTKFETGAINDNGDAVFVATLNDGKWALYKGSAAGPVKVADADSTGFKSVSAVSLNVSGTIAFVGLRADGSKAMIQVKNGVTTTIADTANSQIADFLDSVQINNAGAVVFPAVGKDNESAIIKYQDGKSSTLIDTRNTSLHTVSSIALSDYGDVAFRGTYDSSNDINLFVLQSNGNLKKIIATGQLLGNDSVQGIEAPVANSLNDKGQIVIYMTLASKLSGMFVITP